MFLSPLQRTNLLPASELKALFPNLPEVLQRHRKLSADLKTLAATAPVVKTKPLAEALINTVIFFININVACVSMTNFAVLHQTVGRTKVSCSLSQILRRSTVSFGRFEGSPEEE